MVRGWSQKSRRCKRMVRVSCQCTIIAISMKHTRRSLDLQVTAMFFMFSSEPIQSNKCKCPPNTTHHKDYEAILGKNYKAERRLRVHTKIIEKLILHTRSMWKPLAAEPLFPTMPASGTGPVSGSGPRGPIGKEESSEPIQVFPTESAVRAKEKNQIRGIRNTILMRSCKHTQQITASSH